MCDGTESDGYPGISVINLLEANKILFTGTNSYFYNITTSKPVMKKIFETNGVPTAPFVEISLETIEEDLKKAEEKVGYPFIIKPSVSYASVGIHQSSVCRDRESALELVKKVFELKGFGELGVFVETFIEGREYTVFVVEAQDGVHVYPAMEIVFNKKVPFKQQFLSYELRYNRNFSNPVETPLSSVLSPGDSLFSRVSADQDFQDCLQDVAKRAFKSLNGTGYARVDIRMRSNEDGTPIYQQEKGTKEKKEEKKKVPEVYVLEVNGQCTISSLLNTSVGWIMKLSGSSMPDFVSHILGLALQKAG